MLVVDLDGTALRGRDALAPEDIEAARELGARGIHLSIATGRLYGGTRWVAEALGVRGTVAVLNGSERVGLDDHAPRYRDTLPADLRIALRSVLLEHGLCSFLFRSSGIHHDHEAERHTPFLGTWSPGLVAHDRILDEALWHEADDVLAICAAGAHGAVQAAHDGMLEQLGEVHGIKIFDTFDGESFVSVRNITANKGTALTALAADRGLLPHQVVAVGDWWNDLPMLDVAGRSFAMGGAIPEVLEAADEVLEARRGEGGAIAEIAHKVFGL